MKIKKQNNFAYIDANNLYKGVNKSNWRIDFVWFEMQLFDLLIVYLKDVKNKVQMKTPVKDGTLKGFFSWCLYNYYILI